MELKDEILLGEEGLSHEELEVAIRNLIEE